MPGKQILLVAVLLFGFTQARSDTAAYETNPSYHSAFKNLAEARRDQFCQRLINTIYALNAERVGIKPGSMPSLAASLSEQLISGKIEQFQKISVLAADDSAPTYLSTSDMLRGALASQRHLVISTSTEDLRNLPMVRRGSDVVIVVNSATDLDPERAEAVAKTARSLQLRLLFLWTGDIVEANERSAKGLAVLAALTGGDFIALGSAPTACQRTI